MLAQLPKGTKVKRDTSTPKVAADTVSMAVASELLVASTHETFRIGNVSAETLMLIFSFLSTKDLATAAQVCKRWRSVSASPWLWKNRVRGAPIRTEEVGVQSDGRDWNGTH
jgi:hypothetical protein